MIRTDKKSNNTYFPGVCNDDSVRPKEEEHRRGEEAHDENRET